MLGNSVCPIGPELDSCEGMLGVCADAKQGKPRVVNLTLNVELERAGLGRTVPRIAPPILT